MQAMDHERVLEVMDKDIQITQLKLDRLTTARRDYAAAYGVTRRRSVSLDGEEGVAGSLSTIVLRVMQDGAWWHVDDVLAGVQAGGRPGAAKGSVNTTLARGAEEGGPLEHHALRKGTYRVRPEVVAGWASRAEGEADAERPEAA
jgi:hypothetical protein